jgi:hypothetical protein
MEYFKIPKTVNRYWFIPDYVNFKKMELSGLDIDNDRLHLLQRQLYKKFKFDLVVYTDKTVADNRFGLASMGYVDETFVEYPLIKEFEISKIDSFCIRSFHPTRFGGRLEVMIKQKDGVEVEFFKPIIKNMRYDIWDWCVDKYIIAPMTSISTLTGIGISQVIKEYDN